jgi:hypothetical protein
LNEVLIFVEGRVPDHLSLPVVNEELLRLAVQGSITLHGG